MVQRTPPRTRCAAPLGSRLGVFDFACRWQPRVEPPRARESNAQGIVRRAIELQRAPSTRPLRVFSHKIIPRPPRLPRAL